ncbi:MAG: hypothetical protein WC455_18800 [Dehalococcoidia bacterium]|jgi:Arc/MetJ-type ribon-helix-helix transcriptional regulator
MGRKKMGLKVVSTLLTTSQVEGIEALRKVRSEDGRYVSQAEVIRDYLEFGLKWKDKLEGLWSHT